MGKIEELEARMRVMEDIEAIKKLKSRYWRCLDGKLWDEMRECFTENSSLEVPVRLGMGAEVGKRNKIEGKKAIVDHMANHLRHCETVHQGHTPDLMITGRSTARGIWTLHDIIVDLKKNTVFSGRGFYEDEYTIENGEWRISKLNLYRLHSRHVARSHTVDDLAGLV